MKNNGKRFESNFKNSVPNEILYYRFKDGTGWAGGETRFQCSNICDCLLYDGDFLILAELKNHKGKSLPLTAIRENQIKEMTDKAKYKGVIPVLIVNFEDLGECYFLTIQHLNEFISKGERKSIPVEYFKTHGHQIPTEKKKVNYKYDLSVLFNMF